MQFREITDPNLWNTFLENNPINTFLQSHNWATFNSLEGTKTFQMGLYEKEKLISICLILKVLAKRGTFLLVPHGPVVEKTLKYELALASWTDYLKTLAREEKAVFVRIAPNLIKNEESKHIFENLGYKSAPIHVHAELTTVLDITLSEPELLSKMRKTTRQMIKKGLKMTKDKELEIKYPTEISPEMFEVYFDTYKRGGAVAFSKTFLQNEWQSFSQNGRLISISKGSKVISWGMFLFSNNRAFYHQGGNLLDKHIPNSYLLQWLGILEAKKQGCISYDFWGVANQDNPNHPWANISLFKRGFGGTDVELLHAQDFIISHMRYWPNWLLETFRAKKRGF